MPPDSAQEPATAPRVAVVGPFSGPRAAWGTLLDDAIAAVSGRAAVTWTRYDDQGDAEVAAARAREIVEDGGFAAVVGHFNSLGARAALPLYRDHGLPVVLPLATAPGLTAGAGGLALRLCPDDTGQAAAIVAACRGTGRRAVDAVHDGTGYGLRLAELVRAAAEPLGVPVRLHTHWPASPERAVVLCAVHHSGAALLRERAAAEPGRLIVATDDCDVPEFAELAGPAARGVRVARLTGGPGARVTAAFAALAGALGKHPGRRGTSLTDTVRAELPWEFDAHGDPAAPDPGAGWEVVPVAPRAAGDGPFDVAVVGGGVVGSATAAELAEQGRRVVVLDDGSPGSAASTVSGALVRAFELDRQDRARAVDSFRLLWSRTGEAAAHGFRRTGALVLFGAEHKAAAADGVADLTAAGIAAELLDADEAARRWPDLTYDGIAGAVWEPGGGYALPAVTLAAMADRARRAGVEFRRPRTVRAVREADDGLAVLDVAGESAPDGPLHARAVVLAAGCGTPRLLAGRLPPDEEARTAARAKRIQYVIFGCSAHTATALPTFVDLTTGMWARPDGRDGMLAGHPVDEWDVPATPRTSVTPERIDWIRARVSRRLPFLAAAPALSSTSGRDLFVTPRPLLALLPGRPRTLVAAGWSGGGFKTAPGVSREVARLLDG